MILNKKSLKELKEKLNIHSLERIDIIGIRGAFTMDYGVIKDELIIEYQGVNYKKMNCLFIVCIDDSFIAFHGSTVPNIRYVKESVKNLKVKSNQLMPGVYRGYTLGKHSIGKASEHTALRQTKIQPILRTYDDFDYDDKDKIEVSNPYDNIHASWCELDSEYFETMGCQVIQGYPKGQKHKNNKGDWKDFMAAIESTHFNIFTYLLVPYKWLELSNDICIFGSHSNKVKEIQKKLRLEPDGYFGKNTFLSVLKFQKNNGLKVDGVVGQETYLKLI